MGELYAPSPFQLSGNSEFVVGEFLEGSGLVFKGEGSFVVDDSAPNFSGKSSFVVQGLEVHEHVAGYYHVARYVGESTVPHDIRRRRRDVYEIMRRMGTPVLIKKMFTEDDVIAGIAEPSPNFNPVYGQTRNRDPLSHGIGFVSIERSTNEWIHPTTSEIVTSPKSPGEGYLPAPKYRGYGPGYLVYVIEPDTPTDFFKLTPEGAFMKVQTATAQAPWWPDINDNDLLIHVEVDKSGFLINTHERYQAKQTNPVSIRGAKEQRGRKESAGNYGNRFVINRTFQMSLLPANHECMKVEVDR